MREREREIETKKEEIVIFWQKTVSEKLLTLQYNTQNVNNNNNNNDNNNNNNSLLCSSTSLSRLGKSASVCWRDNRLN